MPTVTAVPRERIFVALFDRLKALPGFVSSSRIYLGWDAVEAALQPRLVMVKGDEIQIGTRKGMPPAWRIEVKAIVLVRTTEGDPELPPSTQINELISAIETALVRTLIEGPAIDAPFQSNPSGTWGTSLGGLCVACQIEGDIITDEGALGHQGVAVIPIAIYTAT